MAFRMQPLCTRFTLPLFGLVVGATTVLVGAQQRPKQAVVAAPLKQVDPAKADYKLDLRPLVKGKRLRDGSNLITTTPKGLRVYAQVERGRIVGIEVKDARGRSLKPIPAKSSVPQRGSTSLAAAPASRGSSGGDNIRCWHCYDINGETHCFEVECPWGPDDIVIEVGPEP
ncbi:MAG: hypothetical protein Kow00109_04650 [Acidobacteriota bacterium]